MIDPQDRDQIARELAMGYQARSSGLEARARVCARRAVGIALRSYFSQRHTGSARLSVVEMIQTYQALPDVSSEIQTVCSHLLARVNPDYELPIPADLLAEAKILIDSILEKDPPHDRAN